MAELNWRNHIASEDGVLSGRACIKGTRIAVELLLREMSEGASEEALLESYPTVTQDDVRAALQFAAACIADLHFYATPWTTE